MRFPSLSSSHLGATFLSSAVLCLALPCTLFIKAWLTPAPDDVGVTWAGLASLAPCIPSAILYAISGLSLFASEELEGRNKLALRVWGAVCACLASGLIVWCNDWLLVVLSALWR